MPNLPGRPQLTCIHPLLPRMLGDESWRLVASYQLAPTGVVVCAGMLLGHPSINPFNRHPCPAFAPAPQPARPACAPRCANETLQLARPPAERFPATRGLAHYIICRETSVDSTRLGLAAAYTVNHTLMDAMDCLGLAGERGTDLRSSSSLVCGHHTSSG